MYSKHTAAHTKKKYLCYGNIQQDENKRSVKFPCRLLANKEFFCFVLRILKCFIYDKFKGHLYLTTYVFWILFLSFFFHFISVRSVHAVTCLVSIVAKANIFWEQKHVPHTVGKNDVVIFKDGGLYAGCKLYGNVNITFLKIFYFLITISFVSINMNVFLL